jgi:hypothetical protein
MIMALKPLLHCCGGDVMAHSFRPPTLLHAIFESPHVFPNTWLADIPQYKPQQSMRSFSATEYSYPTAVFQGGYHSTLVTGTRSPPAVTCDVPGNEGYARALLSGLREATGPSVLPKH